MEKKLNRLKHKQDTIFESIASLFASLAAPVRIRLIHFLSQSPLSVEVLASKIDQSMANTSMHLNKLKREGLVTVKTLGQKRFYTLQPAMNDFWDLFQDFAQKIHPDLKLDTTELYGDLNWTENISDTIKMIKEKKIVLLDIRPEDEVSRDPSTYPEIIHIPYSQLDQEMKKLSKNKKILVFCRGRFCALSAYATNVLREKQFQAYRLEKSWNELKTYF